jgi:hypothetical protein
MRLSVILGLVLFSLSLLPACGGGSFDLTEDETGETDTDTDADADADADADVDSDMDADTDTDVEPGFGVITEDDIDITCPTWTVVHPETGSQCVETCHRDRQTSVGLCCPLGTQAVGDTCPMPDLWVNPPTLTNSLELENQNFNSSSCEIEEGCVNGTGTRRLLRFSTETPNTGVGDMHFGRPADASDLFEWSECHGHYHFQTYASYDLTDGDGNSVATGQKQAFCLMDFNPFDTTERAKYSCSNQGIQAGWADTYGSYLSCQWIDVTGVPAGDYTLTIHVNYDRHVAESDYSNNELSVPVTITP